MSTRSSTEVNLFFLLNSLKTASHDDWNSNLHWGDTFADWESIHFWKLRKKHLIKFQQLTHRWALTYRVEYWWVKSECYKTHHSKDKPKKSFWMWLALSRFRLDFFCLPQSSKLRSVKLREKKWEKKKYFDASFHRKCGRLSTKHKQNPPKSRLMMCGDRRTQFVCPGKSHSCNWVHGRWKCHSCPE